MVSIISENQKLLRRLGSSRGVVMFELAMMLPMLLTLIAGVIEVPRLFIAKNRAVNVARIVADVRSRNRGDIVPRNKVSGGDLHKMIVNGSGNGGKFAGKDITLSNVTDKRLAVSGFFNKITNNEGVRIIAGVVTFGEYQRLFGNVIGMDLLYGGKCVWKVPTILPVEFLNMTIPRNWHGGYVTVSSICYMPNRNGYVQTQRKNPSSAQFSQKIDKNIEAMK